MGEKRLTNLQRRRRIERSRRDARVRLIKKYRPLCVSRGFIEYAYDKKWNDETADAAALLLHRWFMLRKKFDNRLIPIPYQTFKGLFGAGSVKPNGRFYVPMSNLVQELWNFVFFKQQQLSAVDVKSSHVYCLLALLKDIEIHYFAGSGSHDERLSQCQFSQQIAMIPGLLEHLRRASIIYSVHENFKFDQRIPINKTARRKMMYEMFCKFTKAQIKFFKQHHKNLHAHSISSTHGIVNTPNSTNSLKISQTVPYLLSYIHHTDIQIHSSNIPVVPTIHAEWEGVEFEAQVDLYQHVMEILHACRFSLQAEGEEDQSNADVSLFRNLFFPCPEEIAKFERMLQSGFYELLMETTGQDIDHKEFKKTFFHFLYRPAFSRYDKIWHCEDTTWFMEKRDNLIRKTMETLLPSIVFFLDLCKSQPGTLKRSGIFYKQISRAIIGIESKIMLECCANLWKRYPNMFLVTVHDCIKCLPEDVEVVCAELTRTFEKYHVSPMFKVKQHQKPSDDNR